MDQYYIVIKRYPSGRIMDLEIEPFEYSSDAEKNELYSPCGYDSEAIAQMVLESVLYRAMELVPMLRERFGI